MNATIYSLLYKHYLYFDKKLFSPLLLKYNGKTDNEIYDFLVAKWNNPHGGIINLTQFNQEILPTVLPYITSDGKIKITETVSNDKKFQKKYVKQLNNLILNFPNDIIDLDFRNNGGGKPEIMVAGLLPILNNFPKLKVLSYWYNKNYKRHYDIVKKENIILAITNNNSKQNGTKKKKPTKEINIFFNEMTASAAEQSIIVLLGLSEQNPSLKINLYGNESNGLTTCIRYFKLSDRYGIEIPIGYMGTKNKMFQKISGNTQYVN